MNEECVFCKIAKGEIKSNLVYEDDNFIGFLDVNPKAEGHTLIVPKQHFRTILDMPSSLGIEMIDAVKEVSLNLIKKGKADGFNLIINNGEVAGQVVHHVHIHIIPRKKNDGFRMSG
jgi:histidine triad (HIT) family protein